ncbi:MAG TPA: cation:proton antiporter [Candidatus Elarobacter sp.]|jgi:CPA2 family monovalent cation:H+ antiporter-2
MEPRVDFLADLTVALAAAALAGLIAGRLRLNPILGYLAAGILIGPFTPGYVARADTLSTLATLGLIFLLFSLGLGFSFGEIRTLGTRALLGNGAVMALITAVAALGARAAGAVHPLTMALTTTVSSTAVGAALLREWDVEARPPGRYALAQQVVQDLAAVALLVVTTAPAESLSVLGILVPVLKAVAFVAIALVLGATVLPRVVGRILARAPADALFAAFAALALVAAWLGELVGLSFEFGAFVAGAVISEAAGSRMVASVVAPFRALFVALFFVSVGMLLDPRALAAQWPAVLGLGVAFVAVRWAAWSALARLGGMALGGAILVGIAMTSLGEFNVVLVNAALGAHRLDARESQLLLAIVFFTVVVTVVAGPFARRFRADAEAHGPPEGALGEAAQPVVAIVGYGRVGRTVGAVLRESGVAFAALERDRAAVERARADGVDVVGGDGTDPVALERVVRPSTRIVLATAADGVANAAIVHRIAGMTDAQVIARATRGSEVAMLRERGASMAVVPEAEGALVFARAVLRALGVAEADVEARLDAVRERTPAVLDADPLLRPAGRPPAR